MMCFFCRKFPLPSLMTKRNIFGLVFFHKSKLMQLDLKISALCYACQKSSRWTLSSFDAPRSKRFRGIHRGIRIQDIQDFAWHWRKSNCRWPSPHQHEPFRKQLGLRKILPQTVCHFAVRPARRVEVPSVVDFRNQEFLDQKWLHAESTTKNLLQHVICICMTCYMHLK